MELAGAAAGHADQDEETGRLRQGRDPGAGWMDARRSEVSGSRERLQALKEKLSAEGVLAGGPRATQ